MRERPLRDRLCNGALPRPSQPVQPVDRRPGKIRCPEFDLVQDGTTGSLQTALAVAVPISGRLRTREIIEGAQFGCSGPCQALVVGRRKLSDLDPAERGYPIGLNAKRENSRSVCMLGRRSPSVALSAVLVSTEKFRLK